MKKNIRKLRKSKIILYSFIIITLLVCTCAVATYFVGNVTKYWLYFIMTNYASILTFLIAALILSILILFNTDIDQKAIGIIAFIGFALGFGLIFINLALPLDMDIYTMITRSYSEINGPVVSAELKRTNLKYRTTMETELTMHDNIKNENITITFFNQPSYDFRVGENINVKYLPHSRMGISYFHI